MQLSTIYTQRLEEATQKGIEIGEQRGKELTQREIATNLLNTGLEIEQIAQVTGLSLEEVRKLIASNQ